MNAPFLRPSGCPAGVDPADWRQAVAQRIEAHQVAMLALIAALDQMDGDENLEPSLAGFEGSDDDREEADEDGGDIQDECHDGELDQFEGEHWEDAEYSLSWPTAHEDGTQDVGALWAGYHHGDLEG